MSTSFKLQVSSAFCQRQRKGRMRQKARYWLEEEEWVSFYRVYFVNAPSTQKPQRQEVDRNFDPEAQLRHLDCDSINCTMSWVSPLLGHISVLYTDEGNLIKERIPNILEKMQIQRVRHTFEIWKNKPWSCILGKKWVKMLTSKTWPLTEILSFCTFILMLCYISPILYISPVLL